METRLYRSVTSSLLMRKQPDDTAWPIVSGPGRSPWIDGVVDLMLYGVLEDNVR